MSSNCNTKSFFIVEHQKESLFRRISKLPIEMFSLELKLRENITGSKTQETFTLSTEFLKFPISLSIVQSPFPHNF